MKRVVVAESSPTIKSVSDNLLRQNGYNVVCTSDGLQAWEVINSDKPDLVLTGLNLSGITGLELCRQISGDNQVGGIPVVVMVGAKDDISEDELKSTGARGRLKKPFSPRDLLLIVKKLIGEGEDKDIDKDVAVSGDTSKATSYEARVLSTTRHLEDAKGDVYNLDWTDLSDTGSREVDISKNEGGIGAPTDDQKITISKDQFDLESLNAAKEKQRESNVKSSDDEDYEWFVGEMQKDTSIDSETSQPEKKISGEEKAPAAADLSPDDSGLKFDDFGSSDSKIFDSDETANEEHISPKQAETAPTKMAQQDLTEDEISKIADKVSQNLAAAIAANIDRRTIVEAIKSVIKK